jgi:hypothetical protein
MALEVEHSPAQLVCGVLRDQSTLRHKFVGQASVHVQPCFRSKERSEEYVRAGCERCMSLHRQASIFGEDVTHNLSKLPS